MEANVNIFPINVIIKYNRPYATVSTAFYLKLFCVPNSGMSLTLRKHGSNSIDLEPHGPKCGSVSCVTLRQWLALSGPQPPHFSNVILWEEDVCHEGFLNLRVDGKVVQGDGKRGESHQ